MTRSLSYPTILLALFLFILASSCYKDFDCVDGDYLELLYMHNGHNAIFGDQAILDQDSISLTTSDGHMLSEKLSFVDSTMSIRLLMHPRDSLFLLHLGALRTDTFQVTKWFLPLGRECSVFIIDSASLNGDVLCDFNCSEVIEIIF